MSAERIETLVVGGGHAGLAMSHMLTQRGRPHLVLERSRIAERWRTERWDGLRFQFPNWSVRLPNFPLPHADPDGFATSSEIVDFIMGYAAFIAAPIRCGVSVMAIRRTGESGFIAQTPDGQIEAENVVVATGPYQRPVIPSLFADNARIFQVHSGRYRNPDQLPSGAVLVVGSGASGAQICEELLRSGRRVYLSIGRHTRLPRRYRGKDLVWWLNAMGFDQTSVHGPGRSKPLITGAFGGNTIDFRRFAAEGVTLLGRILAVHDDEVDLAPDLAKRLAYGDGSYAFFLDKADAHVLRHGLEMPEEPAARAVLPDPPCLVEPLAHFNLRAAGIGAVIWATRLGKNAAVNRAKRAGAGRRRFVAQIGSRMILERAEGAAEHLRERE
ncbi:MAG TPA: NAD(P)-binding domain-containing protein, partial [Bradyrhizobium sp.]|nr:NAD(P)-binding domain-containing protein [Bradyrhizobium sp.]